MYPISNALKAKFASNAKQYARITVGSTVIDNSRIRLGSFSVNRYALAEDTVVFGSCVAAEFNVTLENGDGAYSTGTFLGNEAYVEVGCDLSGTVTYVPLGYFKFDMVTAQASTLKLSALDRMMEFEKVVNPTPYSVSGTVDSLIDTVCTACGVTRGTFTLPVNGALALSGELTDVKTYRDILRWIGEVTGTIAYIGYDGKLYFGWYSGTSDFSVDPTNRMQGSIADDATTITSVSIVQGENMVTAGTGAKIVIRDNALIPLATGTTAQAIANNLYNHVNGFTYRTFEAGAFPMPHIFPLDCGVYTDLDNNTFNVCCTDWTFTLNANTKIAGKGGKQAYGRGYTLEESVFTARNIAAGAVTADKISVSDLQALGATIGGWTITNNALEHYYTDEVNGKQYLLRFISPIYGANTQGIEVLARDYPNGAFENMFAVKYNGKLIAADGDITGKITATSGKIGGWEISSTEIRKENTYVDSDEFTLDSDSMTMRITHPTGGSYHGSAEAQQTEIGEGVVKATHGVIAHGSVFGGYDFATLSGDGLEVHNYEHEVGEPGAKQGIFGYDTLIVNNHDILRTHQSLVGGWQTSIPANANLNTATYCKVGGYYQGSAATVQTFSNCPTTTAFYMTVTNITRDSMNIDDYNWTYMVREITDIAGKKWIQYVRYENSLVFGPWNEVLQYESYTNGTLTANVGTLTESYCRKAGRVVDIHAWLTGLSTSAQSHTNAIKVSNVSLPSVPIRFVCTCWLGNGIAAYAGYGVMDTYGNITFTKAVANSDKVSFAITYVV